MIRVAIVEDDAEVQGVLQEYVRRYTRQYGTEFEVSVFADGVDILEDYRAVYDIIFLDVEMKHLDGMTTAERIRQMDTEVILIFITNMAQYAIRGYSVGALDYVLKPVPYFAFSQQLLKAVAQRLQTCIRSRDCAFRIGGCRWRAGCAGWTPQASITWKARGIGCTFTPIRAIFLPPAPSRPLRKSWQTAPLPAATAATLSIWHRCGSCGRAPYRWAPASCRSAVPSARAFLPR